MDGMASQYEGKVKAYVGCGTRAEGVEERFRKTGQGGSRTLGV